MSSDPLHWCNACLPPICRWPILSCIPLFVFCHNGQSRDHDVALIGVGYFASKPKCQCAEQFAQVFALLEQGWFVLGGCCVCCIDCNTVWVGRVPLDYHCLFVLCHANVWFHDCVIIVWYIVEFLFDFVLDPFVLLFGGFEFEQACGAWRFICWTRTGQEFC